MKYIFVQFTNSIEIQKVQYLVLFLLFSLVSCNQGYIKPYPIANNLKLSHLVDLKNEKSNDEILRMYDEIGKKILTFEICTKLLNRNIDKSIEHECLCLISNIDDPENYPKLTPEQESFINNCDSLEISSVDSILYYYNLDQNVRRAPFIRDSIAQVDLKTLAFIKRNIDTILNRDRLRYKESISLWVLLLHNTCYSLDQDVYIYNILFEGFAKGIFSKDQISLTIIRETHQLNIYSKFEMLVQDDSIEKSETEKLLVEVFNKLNYDIDFVK